VAASSGSSRGALAAARGAGAVVAVGDDRGQEVMEECLGRWRQAWCLETLRHVVAFHEERNDVGMLLALVAVLGVGSDPDPRIKRKLTRWVQGASDVLARWQSFVSRAALFRSLPFAEIQALPQRDTLLYLRCAYCRANIEPSRGLCSRPAAWKTGVGSVSSSLPSGRPTCVGCHRRRMPPCAVCGEDVRGLWVACQICGHGGHPTHIREWFAGGERRCPAGCGCHCLGFSDDGREKGGEKAVL
ncbi:unnamed protein product, partial [Polarella glacialis]